MPTCLGQVKAILRPHSSPLANKGEVIKNNEAEEQCITRKDAHSRLGGVGEQVKNVFTKRTSGLDTYMPKDGRITCDFFKD